jgi:ABC-type transporter Mla subunit MlaD
MLTPDRPRRRLRGLAAATLLAGLLLMPASTTMAMDAGTAEIEPLGTDVTQSASTVEELRILLDDLSLANDALTADNSTLLRTVDTLASERDQLRDSLGRFDDLYDPLEADRQLLFELRKNLPETRPEAEAQLARIRSLALSSDPARLGQLIDRVDDAAPAFLDWRFGEFDTNAEFSEAYVGTGANAFDSSFEDFRSEVLMSVANRLDGLLTILDRLR